MNAQASETGHNLLVEISDALNTVHEGVHLLGFFPHGTAEAQRGRTTAHKGLIKLEENITSLRVLAGDAPRDTMDVSLNTYVERFVKNSLAWGQRVHDVRFCGDKHGFETVHVSLFRAALTQLVDNAVRYSPGGSPIEVRVQHSPTDSIVSIQNRGIIPPERPDQLFSTPKIGLKVAKCCADAMNGKVESAYDSGRITFSLRFPTTRIEIRGKLAA